MVSREFKCKRSREIEWRGSRESKGSDGLVREGERGVVKSVKERIMNRKVEGGRGVVEVRGWEL